MTATVPDFGVGDLVGGMVHDRVTPAGALKADVPIAWIPMRVEMAA